MTPPVTLARRHPTTLVLALLVLTASLVSGSASGSRAVLESWGIGLAPMADGRGPFALLASLVLAHGPASTVVAVVAVLVLVGVAEHLMGSVRTAIAFVATGSVGALGGVAVEALGLAVGQRWSERSAENPVLDPLTAVVGTFLTASAFADQLWRRRIRVLGFAVLVLLLLYVGTPAAAGRFVAGVAGLVLGMLSTPARHDPFRVPPSSHHESRLLLGSLVLLAAAGPLLTMLSGHPQGPVHLLFASSRALPTPGLDACVAGVATVACVAAVAAERVSGPGAVLLAVSPLLLLALAGSAMIRGRRAGVWLAATVLALSGLLTAVTAVLLPMLADPARLARPSAQTAPTPVETLLAIAAPLVLAVVLVSARRHFPVRSTSRARTAFVVVTGGSLSLAVLVSASAWRASEPPGATDFWIWFVESLVPAGFLSRRLPVEVGGGAVAFLGDWMGSAVGACVLVASLLLVVDTPAREGTSDRARFRRLLRAGSDGSIAHMALWPGNSYWFSRDDRAAVAYRVVGGVALTLGGPVGVCSREAAVHGFADFCEERGWIPAFYSIDARDSEVFDTLGWSRADVGDDAVIDPATFSLSGGRWKDIRTSINRARKTGVSAEWTRWAVLGHSERNQVRVVSEEWVSGRSLPEMGFTLGGVDEAADADVRLMLAVSDTGTVLAVTSWLPTWRDNRVIGWTLDLMRRRDGTMNGIMEFLIAETVTRARDEGVEFVSLSAAPLAGVGQPGRGTGMAEQVLGYLARRLESVYGFRSLLAFKQKFGPEMRPLVVAYPGPFALPAIAVALARSYLPGMTVAQKLALARSILGGVVARRLVHGPPARGRASSS